MVSRRNRRRRQKVRQGLSQAPQHAVASAPQPEPDALPRAEYRPDVLDALAEMQALTGDQVETARRLQVRWTQSGLHPRMTGAYGGGGSGCLRVADHDSDQAAEALREWQWSMACIAPPLRAPILALVVDEIVLDAASLSRALDDVAASWSRWRQIGPPWEQGPSAQRGAM